MKSFFRGGGLKVLKIHTMGFKIVGIPQCSDDPIAQHYIQRNIHSKLLHHNEMENTA